jgi:hypothetical protein
MDETPVLKLYEIRLGAAFPILVDRLWIVRSQGLQPGL